MSFNTPTSYTISHGSLRDSLLAERWESLRARSIQNSPFSSVAFAAGMSKFSSYDTAIFIVSDTSSDLAGILVYTKKKGPFRVATVPPFTSFTSLLTTIPLRGVATSDSATPYSLLLHTLRQHFDSILLHHHPALDDVRLFQWASWQTNPLYTYHIDLTDLNKAESAWSSSTRRTYKKHAASYSFKEDPHAVKEAVALATGSYQRHGRPIPLPPDQLVSFASSLQKAGMVRMFTVTPNDEDRPTAALALLHDEEVAYYWLAGSVPGHSMTVLLGQLLPRLAADGIRLFDFVGANTPYIAEFKRRFGPALIPYYATGCSPGKLFASLQSLKSTIASWRRTQKM